MEDFNKLIGKFNLWVRTHKLFALSAPIVLLLLIFFVSTSIDSMSNKDDTSTQLNGYNNHLPNQNKELVVKNPNEVYQKSKKDSIKNLSRSSTIRNIDTVNKENDSLQQILNELDEFSFEADQIPEKKEIPIREKATSPYVDKQTEVKEKLEYRKLLLQARQERESRTQDYSAPFSEPVVNGNTSEIKFEASVYQDQFILPGTRVTLILNKDENFRGSHFPKNTFVYAIANVQGSRVLLEVTNINKVRLRMTAFAQEDGMIGLYNERAGELLNEFKADIVEKGLNELASGAGQLTESPLANTLVNDFGNFFVKKKYKQRDKILLVNGDLVDLVIK